MRTVRSLAWCLVLLLAAQVFASNVGGPIGALGVSSAEAAVVRSIRVDGNTRVDDETVVTYLTIRPGVSFGPSEIDESIKTLFATGLFSDVQINQRGGTLVVTVVENAVINRISIEGNRRLDDETLESVIQSQPRTALSNTIVQADVQRLLEMYRRRGRFQATVEAKVIDLDATRVDLVFEVNEGRETGIARINFIGNRAFSDGRLREVIETRQSGLLGFLRKTDTYDPDRLDVDQELLRDFYYNSGYADFRIISAVADFDRERNVFFVTFTVDEGERYRFGDVEVQTSLTNVDPEELRRRLRTREGRIYSAERVEKSIEDMVLDVAEDGYAFAQIRPRGDRDFENKTINVTYYIDEGPRVFVERIEIRGNTKTREYVIRREFDFAEGDAFNRVLLEKAERRLEELNFFERVNISTQPGSAPDRVVVVVDVADKPTGELGFGAGYSSSDGVIGDISIQERNFLGRGHFVRASVGAGEDAQTYNFEFTEPYFLGRRMALSTRLYHNENGPTDSANYDLSETGARIGLTVPLNDSLSAGVFYKISSRDLTLERTTGTDANNNGIDDGLEDTNGNGIIDGNEDLDGDGVPDGLEDVSLAIRQIEGRTLSSLAGYTLIFDTRNDSVNPSDGYAAQFTQEFAGLGGDVHFIRTEIDAIAYKELLPAYGIVGLVKARYGNIFGLGEDLQIIDQFFGGPTYVRGFETAGFGPRDAVTRDALGARHIMSGSAEVQAPVPFLPPDFGLSLGAFADAGLAFDTDPGSTAGVIVVADEPGLLRSSVGVSVIWKSPFGPIRADFAYPLTKSKYDDTQFVRIGGHTTF